MKITRVRTRNQQFSTVCTNLISRSIHRWRAHRST